MQNHKNHLSNSKSIYLQQHAGNPVQWYPWCEEAFAKAKLEDKPVFLSIGYSTCHWCHVMEKESFEDEFVAELMNENFINIKVDREERPDIDNIYMSVTQMMTGGGGWPMTVLLTPDKKPFFAGTYFPKYSRFNRIGMVELIPKISSVWKNEKNSVLESADSIIQAMEPQKGIKLISIPNENLINQAINTLASNFDNEFGGFGNRPKFPTPHNLNFLLQSNDEESRAMALLTLEKMRIGGIYDQVGYGFHRYSTDREWKVPHFEKMLYDNALLIKSYTLAYSITKKEIFKDTANEIIDYLIRVMKRVEGGYSAAEDADSEGVEGKFYEWKQKELEDIGVDNDFMRMFNVNEEGNFEDEATGQSTLENILYITNDSEYLAGKESLNKYREKIFNRREKRIKPLKDTKILCDWNCMLVSSLVLAGKVFSEQKYIEEAQMLASFIKNKMINEGDIFHVYYDELSSEIEGNIDDYIFYVRANLDLYFVTFNLLYLEEAIKLTEIAINKFWDNNEGGFYFSSNTKQDLIIRSKESHDSAIPSSNSIALSIFNDLFKITSEIKWRDYADRLVRFYSEAVTQYPSMYIEFVNSFRNYLEKADTLVIIRDSTDEREFRYNEFSIEIKESDLDNAKKLIPYLEGISLLNNKTTFIKCKEFSCGLPTNEY